MRICEDTYKKWCRRGDSNPHELPHTPLKRARLPVPPLRPKLSDNNDSAKRAFALRRTKLTSVLISNPLCNLHALSDSCGESSRAIVYLGDTETTEYGQRLRITPARIQ